MLWVLACDYVLVCVCAGEWVCQVDMSVRELVWVVCPV